MLPGQLSHRLLESERQPVQQLYSRQHQHLFLSELVGKYGEYQQLQTGLCIFS